MVVICRILVISDGKWDNKGIVYVETWGTVNCSSGEMENRRTRELFSIWGMGNRGTRELFMWENGKYGNKGTVYIGEWRIRGIGEQGNCLCGEVRNGGT